MLKKERMSIISYVLWRVLPMTMALMLTIWVATRLVTQQALNHEISERLDHEAEHVARSIDARLFFLIDTVENLAANDLIINSLIDTTARDQYLPPFFQSLRISGMNNALITLLDYRGRIIAANSATATGNEMADWLPLVMNGDIRYDISADGMQIVAPVRYRGMVEGALEVSAGASDALDLFQSVSTTADYAVIDMAGQTVMFASSPFLDEYDRSHSAAPASGWQLARQTLEAFPAIMVISAEKTANVIGRFSKLDIFLFGAMLLDLLALFCGVALCARLFAGPLSTFTHQLTQIQDSGDLKQRIRESGPAEFRLLVRSFNALFGRLQQTTVSRDQLERLIKQRTSELKQTQKRLVHQAFEAGQAQLAAMVMHNIGNAITPVQVQLDCLQTGESGLIVTYLRQCLQELQTHRQTLTEYVRADPRGQKVFALMGDLVQSLEKDESRRRAAISGMRQSTGHISEILSLQQAYAFQAREQRQQTHLNQLILDALRMQRSALEKRGIRIEQKLAADLPALMIDKNRLIQVLVNLIKNSYEAIDQAHPAPANARICVESAPCGSGIRFSIRDNGIGIAADRLDTVLRVGHSSKGTSGFGLYYCKMFVENNHGQLQLQSRGQGRGATVIITFGRGALDDR